MKMEKWVLGLALAIDEDLSGVLGLAPAIYGKSGFLA